MHTDILLFNSPVHDYSVYPKEKNIINSQPLGVLSIATYLRNHGFHVKFVDAEYEKLSNEDIYHCIEKIKPSYVGFNVFTPNRNIIKKILFSLPMGPKVLLGGPHITAASHEELSSFENVDFFVRGRGEIPTLKLLQTGMVDMNGALTESQQYPDAYYDKEAFPIIDREIISKYQYINNSLKFHEVYLSVGCQYSCAFCFGSKALSYNRYYKRDNESIHEELDYLINREKVQLINLHDDCAFLNREELMTFARMIGKYKIKWVGNASYSVLVNLSEQDYQFLYNSGCYFIAFGIETVSNRLMKLCNKYVDLDGAIALTKRICSSGIKVKTYFIIGIPTETRTETDEVFHYINKIANTISPSMYLPRIFLFKPYPGTGLWNYLISLGYTENSLYDSFSDIVYSEAYFSRHGWGSALSFSDYTFTELSLMADNFYKEYFDSNFSE